MIRLPGLRVACGLPLLLAACSEYGVNGKPDDPVATDTDTDTTPVDSGTTYVTPPPECPDGSAEAIEVALNDACEVPPEMGSFTPVIEWTSTGHNGYGPPSVGNLDDDNGDGNIDANDIPDIVYLPNDWSGILALDGATGAVKWQNPDVNDWFSSTAMGDVDGDGIPEIAASNGPTRVALLSNTGDVLWQVDVDSTVNGSVLYSSLNPAIADMDGDGQAEIVAGHTILDNQGNILGTGTHGVGAVPNANSPSLFEGSVAVPVDTDGDGQLEVVVGNAIYDMYGNALHTLSGLDGNVAVADLDLDGEPEYVVASTNRVFTLETDLTPTGWSDTFGVTSYVGPVAIDDLNGDGSPDFVAVGSGEMRAYNADGSRLWSQPVHDTSGAAGPVLFDFEMDGYPEIVYADERTVRVFNGLDGTVKLESSDHYSATLFETPVVADVDHDGEVEIVMLHGGGTNGITVYGDADHTWPAGRPTWNQHAYTITNVEDDEGIPASATPNWELYNNFRSGDVGLPPARWDDVTPELVDVCTVECPDRLHLTVRVWNQGTEEVAAGLGVVVRAGPTGPVVSAVTLADPIASGSSSIGVEIVVIVADLGGAEPWIEVDRDVDLLGALDECVEDNNAMATEAGCG